MKTSAPKPAADPTTTLPSTALSSHRHLATGLDLADLWTDGSARGEVTLPEVRQGR